MRSALFRKLAVLALMTFALAWPLMSASQARAAAKAETAIFAGGCFWCMESDMKAIPGVVSVESGYTGGTLKNPHYSDVITEQTGHYESVRVTFDPAKITYRQLLDRYWKLVDPTDSGGQFCDRGPSYRPAVFVNGPAQQKAAEDSRAAAAKNLKTGRMLTQILPATTFYPAEEEHRDFAKRHALQYEMYRTGCGRDARLAQVWGRAGG
ncbi:MAG TPA: peptide-methionine (S)-S-oxide reductase MsrA [Caulobacteraceae bacterium]|jgi:peptide-methionine (S)-S-oxide reductase